MGSIGFRYSSITPKSVLLGRNELQDWKSVEKPEFLLGGEGVVLGVWIILVHLKARTTTGTIVWKWITVN